MDSMTVGRVQQSSSAGMNKEKTQSENTQKKRSSEERAKADEVQENQKAKSSQEEQKEQKISATSDDNTSSTVIVNSMTLSFSVDDKTEQVVVTVMDSESGEEIRQIPSEEVLEMARMLDKYKGRIVNRTL